MYGLQKSRGFGQTDLGGSVLEGSLSKQSTLEKSTGWSQLSVRPSVLHAISSAFPPNKRSLIELVVTELFNEFSAKPDSMTEDAKYGLCIPTLYSVLLLTVCHVHKLKDFEEEWFDGFLKSKKFPLLTPFGCKTEALFNLLNALACFGSSLKKRPATMQGVELVLLRLGISFYFSLCQIMDHPFSTNRFIRALITGAHEWIHGPLANYNLNELEAGVSRGRRSSFARKRNKELIQEHTVRSLIGIFDDFSIKLICIFGYRPNCITWNEVNKYVQGLNDVSLAGLFKNSNLNGGFFQESLVNEFVKSVPSFYRRSSQGNGASDEKKGTGSYILTHDRMSTAYNVEDIKGNGGKDLPLEEYRMSSLDFLGSSGNYQKEDTFSLSEFQDSDTYEDDEIDNEFDKEFSEKLYGSEHNTNRALDAISSKIRGITVSTSGKIFNLNILTKKYLNKMQSSREKKGSAVEGGGSTDLKGDKAGTRKEGFSGGFGLGDSGKSGFEAPSISKKPSWSQFAQALSNHGEDHSRNPERGFMGQGPFNPPEHRGISDFIRKQQIYESEDGEDPLDVL
ncbi:hypothetical protein HWI79_37 [Cryptosporidium felis]|nr:hypothetical protein HWI79_37 [Cryptosporidium felis]